MPRNLFDVELGDGDIDEEEVQKRKEGENLSPRARKVLGYEEDVEENIKEGGMPRTRETVDNPDSMFEYLDSEGAMVIDSPNKTWDVLGHIKLRFDVRSYDEVMDVVYACGELWQEMAEAADLEEEEERTPDRGGNGRDDYATDKQVDFIDDLITQIGDVPRGMDLPRNLRDLTFDEADATIKELLEMRNQSEDRGRNSSRRSSRRAPQRSSGRNGGRDDGDFDNLQGDVTPGQLSTIKDLADQLNERPPRGLSDMSKQEASDWISEAIADLNN